MLLINISAQVFSWAVSLYCNNQISKVPLLAFLSGCFSFFVLLYFATSYFCRTFVPTKTIKTLAQEYKVCTKVMMHKFTYEEIKEFMNNAISWKMSGNTFEEWLHAHDGTINGYVGWVGSLIRCEQVDDMRKALDEMDGTIKEGTPCTIFFYSDRSAATITEVFYGKSGKNKGLPVKVYVRANVVKCKDFYNDDYDILPELEGGTYCFTKRRGCNWVSEGSPLHSGLSLGIGFRRHYVDPSF